VAGELAQAPAAEAIAAWSGLGYNRRALALRAAAALVVERGWPGDAAGLRSLPGVGPYTAAAVASFAFGEHVAAVDPNVRRVLERHDGRARRPRELAQRAAGLLPPGRAATFNQAMMELGATVCTPRRPRCDSCPVAPGCAREPARPSPPARRRAGPGAIRFEDTDRWLRGRIVAALVEGGPPPHADPERMDRAIAALERDGLVTRSADGGLRLPGSAG
jgi:A/G-specific adenine glycosylase